MSGPGSEGPCVLHNHLIPGVLIFQLYQLCALPAFSEEKAEQLYLIRHSLKSCLLVWRQLQCPPWSLWKEGAQLPQVIVCRHPALGLAWLCPSAAFGKHDLGALVWGVTDLHS